MSLPILHAAHEAHEAHGSILEAIGEILLDGLLDTLKILPFLFLTYLLMELLEHRAGDRIKSGISRAGRVGPLVGGAVGLLPQCGFSALSAGLFSGRVITIGTLLAVFFATSDEMLPIFIASAVPAGQILLILGIKFAVAVAVGFLADLLLHARVSKITVPELCAEENCHCENGILRSALHHTCHIGVFILVVNLALGALFCLVGQERIAAAVGGLPVVRELIGALIGLIPNCAASVALATLYAEGLVPLGVLIAGLLPAAGAGILVLLRTNRPRRMSIAILGALVLVGALVGILIDLTPLASLSI